MIKLWKDLYIVVIERGLFDFVIQRVTILWLERVMIDLWFLKSLMSFLIDFEWWIEWFFVSLLICGNEEVLLKGFDLFCDTTSKTMILQYLKIL